MDPDEAHIRPLIADFMNASIGGDIGAILDMVSEDVVFLLPGQQSIVGETAFGEHLRAITGPAAPRIQGHGDVREVQVRGDRAFAWAQLSITLGSPASGRGMTRAGFTLSVFRRENGRWRLARDANMLTPVLPAVGD